MGLWPTVRMMTVLSALLAAGLLIWAVKDRHVESVTAARNFKVTDVQFREDGTIAAFSGRVAKGAS